MSPDRSSVAGPRFGTLGVLGAAGVVGSAVTFALVNDDIADTVVAVDPRTDLMQAHAIDIRESALVRSETATELVVGEASQLEDLDVLLLCASMPEDPRDDRRSFLDGNFALLQQVAPQVAAAVGSHGVVVLVTNPVDILAEITRRLTGLAAHRIVGYSLNDSIRFRMALGRELGVPPRHVAAWVLGEHGRGQVPLFSRIWIDGQPVELDAAARARVRDDVDAWFPRWARLAPGRSSGWTTPLGLVRTLRAMLGGGMLPSAVVADGAYGLPDTYLTLPARLSRTGRAGVEQWELPDDEVAGLHSAAAAVLASADERVPGR